MSDEDKKTFFASAVRGTDGEVDTGYLIMFVGSFFSSLAIVLAVLAIPALVVGAWMAMYLRPDHVFEINGLGSAMQAILLGIAGVLTGLGTVCAAGGYFRGKDKDQTNDVHS